MGWGGVFATRREWGRMLRMDCAALLGVGRGRQDKLASPGLVNKRVGLS